MVRMNECRYERRYMAMPTTHRTNDYATPSLALTNGSTFGELLLFIRHGRKFTRLNVRRMSHSPGVVNQTSRTIRSFLITLLLPIFFF